MKSTNPFCGHDQSRFVELSDPQNEFECGACRFPILGERLSCTCCGFNLHLVCNTCPESLSPLYLHPHHPLTLARSPPTDLRCDLCSDPIKGMYYTCQINGRLCNFDLHPSCAILIELYPPVRVHSLDPTHCLELNCQPEGTRICDVCGEDCGGFEYRCLVCSVDAHTDCLVSPDAGADHWNTASLTLAAHPSPTVGRQPGIRKRDLALKGFKLALNVVALINGVGPLFDQ